MAKKRIAVVGDLDKPVREAAGVLNDGGVIVFPTETVYGIGVAADNAAALKKLRQLKQRTADKPFQLLVADAEMARRIGAVFTTRCLNLAAEFWPGPLTMVVPDGTRSGTLGIRVPDSPFTLALIEALGQPIISSSANVPGQPPPLDAAAADVFGDDVDLLVDAGPVVEGTPSTVIRCTGDKVEVLRAGAVDEDIIRSAWLA